MGLVFLQSMGRCGFSSFFCYEFEWHSEDNVNCLDEIYTNGHEIDIADYTKQENLDYLISIVKNKDEFKRALLKDGLSNSI